MSTTTPTPYHEDDSTPGRSTARSTEANEAPEVDNEEELLKVTQRSQEAFDTGVWAALDICRKAADLDGKYNPFEAFEERIILLALRSTGGNQYRAAKLLGISRSTLRKRIKKHEISIDVKVVERKG